MALHAEHNAGIAPSLPLSFSAKRACKPAHLLAQLCGVAVRAQEGARRHARIGVCRAFHEPLLPCSALRPSLYCRRATALRPRLRRRYLPRQPLRLHQRPRQPPRRHQLPGLLQRLRLRRRLRLLPTPLRQPRPHRHRPQRPRRPPRKRRKHNCPPSFRGSQTRRGRRRRKRRSG